MKSWPLHWTQVLCQRSAMSTFNITQESRSAMCCSFFQSRCTLSPPLDNLSLW